MELAIANTYGNVDIRAGVPKRYRHVPGKRLAPLCRKLGIKFAPAVVGFAGEKRYGYRPTFDGVVVHAVCAPKVIAAIEERQRKATSPTAVAKKEKQRVQKERRKAEEELLQAEAEKCRLQRCDSLGIEPDGYLAKQLETGNIDEDTAELLGFKAHYRHAYTDYDRHFSGAAFRRYRTAGFSPSEARESLRSDARAACIEETIPQTWGAYLEKYGFDSEEAKALAGTLADPTKCHPRWFKEAEIAIRRYRLPLGTLAYAHIKEVIDAWRCEQ